MLITISANSGRFIPFKNVPFNVTDSSTLTVSLALIVNIPV